MGIRQSMADALIGILYVCALLIALILGIYSVQQGHITVGNLITIYMAGDRVMSLLIGAASTYNVLQSTVPILDQILKESKEVARHTGIIQTSDDTLLTLEKVTVGYDQIVTIKEKRFFVRNVQE